MAVRTSLLYIYLELKQSDYLEIQENKWKGVKVRNKFKTGLGDYFISGIRCTSALAAALMRENVEAQTGKTPDHLVGYLKWKP